MIIVTQSAAKQLQSLLAGHVESGAGPGASSGGSGGSTAASSSSAASGASGGRGLRIFVETGGCTGIQYGMALDHSKEGDEIIQQEGVLVFIDPFSTKYLHGSTIDFFEDASGSGFRINNPNPIPSCGCGGGHCEDHAEEDHADHPEDGAQNGAQRSVQQSAGGA